MSENTPETKNNTGLELNLGEDPIQVFESWLKEATSSGCAEPTAMTLATATKDGVPSARTVLFKGLKNKSLKFFTNYESPKAQDLIGNPVASLVFLWTSSTFQRQLRIFGRVEKLTADESFDYFKTRARGSQIGAWSSPQSQKVSSRAELEALLSNNEKRFHDKAVPLPPHWGGFALTPERMEFWEGRQYRIHERFVFEKNQRGEWQKRRLAP